HTRSDRDWSSDVCSSDLRGNGTLRRTLQESWQESSAGFRCDQSQALLNVTVPAMQSVVARIVWRMIRGRPRLLLPLLGVWLASALVFASGPDLSLLEDKVDRIISRSRGTIGVSLIHVESGATLSVRGDERFPMASVYKLPI